MAALRPTVGHSASSLTDLKAASGRSTGRELCQARLGLKNPSRWNDNIDVVRASAAGSVDDPEKFISLTAG